MSNQMNKVAVKVQQRSGFDKSHMTIGSGKTGVIYPIMVDEVIPNSKVNLKMALSASLPPLAVDTYLRTSVKCEAFFVPMRLLCGSFEKWFTQQYDDADKTPAFLPTFAWEYDEDLGDTPGEFASAMQTVFGKGTLMDYLGARTTIDAETNLKGWVSLMPALGYQKVFDDWYRNSLIQRPVFERPITYNGTFSVQNMPYIYLTESSFTALIQESADLNDARLNCADGQSVFSLRSRNFGDDPFTIATQTAQLGNAQSVQVVSSGGVNSFTIAALRAGNSAQQFEEFNQLAGGRFNDQLKVRYNANLSDGVAQRSLFLGSADFEVYSKGIYQASDNVTPNGRNPYNSVGARYGSAYGSGQEFIINGFTAQEPGYIFVMATLVPRATYGFGIDRILKRYSRPESLVYMANPILQNVGNEPIYDSCVNGALGDSYVLGYGQRYQHFMYKPDTVHGELRKGGSLQHFALRRDFEPDEHVEQSTTFLQIPVDYIDSIFSVAPQDDDPRFWFDAYFDYKVSQPIAQFSIPSLQNPAYEHGETVIIRRGGITL